MALFCSFYPVEARGIYEMKVTESESFCGSSETAYALLNESGNVDILCAVRKYCTEKSCFRGKKPGKQTGDFYTTTKTLLSNEVSKKNPDDETVLTVLSNMLLLLNNLATGHSEKLTMIQYDTATAMKYLEETCKIEKKYKDMLIREEQKSARKLTTDRRRRVLRWLRRLFAVLMVVLLLACITGFFLPRPQVPVEQAKPFYTEALDWVRNTVLGQEEPEIQQTFTEQMRPYLNLSGIAFLVLGILYFLIWIGTKILKQRRLIINMRTRRDWQEYQLLKDAFEKAEQRLSELEE